MHHSNHVRAFEHAFDTLSLLQPLLPLATLGGGAYWQSELHAIAFAAAVVTPAQRQAFANMVRSELSRLPPMCRGEGSLHRLIADCQKSFANINQITVGPGAAKQRGRGAYKAKAK